MNHSILRALAVTLGSTSLAALASFRAHKLDMILRPIPIKNIWTRHTNSLSLDNATVTALNNKALRGTPNKMLTEVFDEISDAVFIVDPSTHSLIYMNHYALSAQGWSNEEMALRTIEDTNFGLDRSMVDSMLQGLVKEGKASLTLQSTANRKTCNTLAYSIPVAGDGHVVLMIARDISQQAEAESERKELLSVITHELRTPLTSIKGALELLQAGTAGDLPEQASSLVRIAAGNSVRMLGLIRDILKMEEIGQAGFEITTEPTNLSVLMQTVIEAHRGYGVHLGVTFSDTGTEPDIFVMSDQRYLTQILSNLLSNAAKVTQRGGDVEIWACREGDIAAIYVRDHGDGIPENLRDTLFDRFARSALPNRSNVSGSGLGLSIVKTLVTKLGGLVDFETGTGKGTTFRVAFPLIST